MTRAATLLPRPYARLWLGIALTAGVACSQPGPTDRSDRAEYQLVAATSSGTNQQGMTGRPLAEPLRVVVTNDGVAVPNAIVLWATEYGTIASHGPTDANGLATATWTMPYRPWGLRMALASLPDRPESAVRFVANPSHPSIEILDGYKQQGAVDQAVGKPLQVRVTWQGTPVVGEATEWLNGEILPPQVTDNSGVVRATWKLGTVAGTQRASLRPRNRVADGPQAVFEAVARPGPAAVIGRAGIIPRFWEKARDSSMTALARLSDVHGNIITGAPVVCSVATSSGRTIEPVTALTDLTGISTGIISIGSADAGEGFTVFAALPDVTSVGTTHMAVDFLAGYGGPLTEEYFGPWGNWWGNTTVAIAAGNTVRWASTFGQDHAFSFIETEGAGQVTVLGPAGSLAAIVALVARRDSATRHFQSTPRRLS